MVDLLEQWLADNKTYALEPSTETFAEDIFERCGGYAGLTGFCCCHLAELLVESETSRYTAAAWSQQCVLIIPDRLEYLGTYQRIIQDLKGLEAAPLALLEEVSSVQALPSYSQGALQVSQDANGVTTPQVGFSQVLFKGAALVPVEPSEAANHLLALGFIKQEEHYGDHSFPEKVFVIAAPLLATVMLNKLTMEIPNMVNLPPAGAETDIEYASTS